MRHVRLLVCASLLSACGEVELLESGGYPNLPDEIGVLVQCATCPNGGNVDPVVPGFGAGIDAYAAYDGQKNCDPTPKPGVVAFRDLVLATYPCTGSSGISRACDVGGTSEHKEGRAWDWKIQYPHPAADALLAWLLKTDKHGNPHAMFRRFGLMYMIWNSQIWKSYQADKGWQAYSGASPHTDHVHFSFSWAGAKKTTTFWTAPLPADSGPPPPLDGPPPPLDGPAVTPDGAPPPAPDSALPPRSDGGPLPPPLNPGGAPAQTLRGGCGLVHARGDDGAVWLLLLLLSGAFGTGRRAARPWWRRVASRRWTDRSAAGDRRG